MTSANGQSLRAEPVPEEVQEFAVFAMPVAAALTPEEAVRSATNLALWRGYLPEDCVAAMIGMGWHLTA